MDHKRLFSLTLTACRIFTIVPGLCVLSYAADKSQTNPAAEQHFQKANELQIAADYDAAIAEYQTVISLSPNSKIAQNAQYWIGQVYFQSKHFDAALSAFQKLIDEFPTSMVVPTTKLMIQRVQQAKKNRALFEAVKKANVQKVKLLLAEGADVNGKDPNGETALNLAVGGGHKDMVALLIEKGADINGKGRYDAAPLHNAAWDGNKEIAELLIDKGADVNILQNYAYGTHCWTPLHSACYRGHADVAELLVANGADVNAKDEWGDTPLDYAIDNDDSDIMNILIAKGADVNAKDDRGQTALHRMLDVRRHSDTSGYRLSKDTIELLLNKGADVNSKDKDGRTPLHLAAESVDADIVKVLLDKGARVNQKDDESGFTALHCAARFGNENAAELLIARGADINAKDKKGHTPLYLAVNSDYKVATLLIDKGADSSIRAESGKTLLQLAQERRQIESTIPDMIFDGDPNSLFGYLTVCGDVDGDGYDDVLIGAIRYNNSRGRVYLFYGGPDMDTTPDLIFEGQNEGDYFGDGIACGDIDNDGYEDIIIGAEGHGGRAYLYWGSDRNSMDAHPDKIFTGENKKGSRFGFRSAVYDIDNDGYADIILGAYWYPGDATGRAYLYYGNTKESMDTSYDLILTAENPRERFGGTISCGDVNNDGYGDMVIGGWAKQRQAYLYYGASKSNMDAKVDVILEAPAPSKRYGYGNGLLCVDQNRDGYDDVLVGAPDYNYNQGRAYLFYGRSKRSLDVDPDMTFNGEVEQSHYGVKEACGDIDGDNVNDLIIAANGSGQRVGRVYVYWGSDLVGSDPKPGRILRGESPNTDFGVGLACGDVNNDGFDDLVVGACGPYEGGARQGRVYLYYGGPRKK
jgi:ankyrin repeat protein